MCVFHIRLKNWFQKTASDSCHSLVLQRMKGTQKSFIVNFDMELICSTGWKNMHVRISSYGGNPAQLAVRDKLCLTFYGKVLLSTQDDFINVNIVLFTHTCMFLVLTVNWSFCFCYRLCGYIVSTAPEVFVCHVFHCAPNAAPLTKALAEACQVGFINQ